MNESNLKYEIERTRLLLEEILELMIKYNHITFIPGIKGVLGILYDESISDKAKISEAGNAYRSMCGGYGSFADWVVYTGDKKIDFVTNKRIDYLMNEIWKLLKLDLGHLPSVDEGYPPGHPYWDIPGIKDEKK